MLSLFFAALSATNPAPIAGASLWLNYDRPVSTATRSKITIKSIVCPNSTANEITGRACQELSDGLAGLLGSRPTTLPTSGTQPVGNMVVLAPKSLAAAPWPPLPDKESFEIKYSPEHGAPIHISSDNAAGTLYGVFRFLHLLRRENMTTSASSAPALPLRSWNLWDNRDRSIERGYAGTSVFDYDAFPTMLPRYRDYARLLASVGINVIVWDNVNACAKGNEDMLKPDVITAMAPIVTLFYQHGIRSFLVPCYSSPIKVGGLPNADPKDATVAKWWADTAALIQHTWSTDGRTNAFGGFLIKADCEGEPGPDTYNVTELEGANLLADALGPVDGIAIWRAFAHPPKGTDQAIWQFDLFKDWNKENATRANVVLQIKSGPYDFQVREPPHSLFGALNNVNLIIEFEATQEYLGQARHVCHLAPQWSWYMNFDTHCPVPTQTSSSSSEIEVSTLGTTIADVVGGKLRPAPYNKRPRWTGIAAVSNLGSEVTWTHHPMSAANTYSFGRIAWAPTLDPEEITREWVEATFGVGNATVTNVVMDIMTSSWIAYEVRFSSPYECCCPSCCASTYTLPSPAAALFFSLLLRTTRQALDGASRAILAITIWTRRIATRNTSTPLKRTLVSRVQRRLAARSRQRTMLQSPQRSRTSIHAERIYFFLFTTYPIHTC